VAVGRVRASSPRRRHQQHFLRSTRLAADLVRDSCVGEDDLVLDIGAGTGVLTAELAGTAGRVLAIEIDGTLAAELRRRFAARPTVQVLAGDFLRMPLPLEPFRVVANIPFARTTAIMRRLLDDRAVPLERADLIVELAVARKRACPVPSTALGAYWGAWWELAFVRRIDATAFAPPPQTDAAVLRVVRRSRPLVPAHEADAYHALISGTFRQNRPVRRALRGSISQLAFKHLSRELGFAPAASAWELDQHQWAALYRFIRSRG
jgi:23S rRNA (adenine-N6)-dimethyltransferase